MNRVADKIAMIARSATKVAAATRYCVAAVCGSSRLPPFPHQRFAHRVMAAARTTMPRSATPRARDFVATRMGTGFAGGLLCCAAAARRYCAAADCGSSRRQPFPHRTAAPHRVRAAHEGHQPFAATLTQTLSRRERERSPFPPLGESWIEGWHALHAASPTRYCAAADCGRRGMDGIPASKACAHRVMPSTPQSRVRGHVGLNQRFLTAGLFDGARRKQ
jgi:hypothetical protein